MRSAHETLDPEEIGELVVTHAAQWLHAPSLAIYAVDMDGQIGLMASRGMTATLAAPAAGVASGCCRTAASSPAATCATICGCAARPAPPSRCRCGAAGG